MKIKNKFFWLSILILFIALFAPINGKAGGASYDKLAHVLLFSFVSINALFYFSYNTKKLGTILGFIGILPVLTEFVQGFISGRNYETLDIVADYFGLIIGLFIFVVFKKQFISLYKLFGDIYRPNPGEIKFL